MCNGIEAKLNLNRQNTLENLLYISEASAQILFIHSSSFYQHLVKLEKD